MARAEMRLKNRELWIQALETPVTPPISATWIGIDAILSALGPFAECGCNHFLLPTGGGMDVKSVVRSREPGCIELVIRESTAYIVRPKRLILEHFPQAPIESFLLLELSELEPTGIYEGLIRPMEELVDAYGDYVDRSHWDEGSLGTDDDGRPTPLPEDSRLIVRFLSGKVMIVSKGSIWNGDPGTYDARHSHMEAHDIRRQISDALSRRGPD